MTYLAATLVVLLSAGAAALGSHLVSRFVSLEARRRHYEVGSVVFLQLGVVYAVLLAFVFSEVWGEYNVASQAISAECGALHGSAMLAHDLADGTGVPLDRAVAAYVTAVIATEWPLMAQRQASSEALRDFEAMLDRAAKLTPARPQDAAVQAQILSLLAGAHAQRESRLFQMTQGLPILLWALLIFYTAVLAGFVLFAGIEVRASHILLSALFAGCTVLILVVIQMLNYPFEGALALQPTDFQGTLEKVSRLVGGAAGPPLP